MNITDYRATWQGLVLVCLSLLSGCGHMVQLANMHQVVQDTDVSPLRRVTLRGVCDGTPQSGTYLVGPDDVVELSTNGRDAIAPMTCDDRFDACNACPEKVDLLPPDVALASPGKRVRMSALALQQTRGVRLTGKDEVVCMGTVVNAAWSDLKQKLQQLRVAATLLPQESQWAMPGDVVHLTAEYRFGLRAGSAPEPYTFAAATTKIDSGGRAYVPAFAKPLSETDAQQTPVAAVDGAASGTNAGTATQAPATGPAASQAAAAANQQGDKAASPYNAVEVVATQLAETAARRITFWQPGKSLDQQPTLAELERCLKAVSAVSPDQPLNQLFSRCASLGIDAYHYPSQPANNRELSYHFSVEHHVTFVPWNGQRVVKPYRAGQTVAEAAKEVHRDLFGHEVSNSDGIYAVVDPHPAIRSSGETPFYARLVDSAHAILDQVLLLPGDVVHLSRWEPRLPLESSWRK